MNWRVQAAAAVAPVFPVEQSPDAQLAAQLDPDKLPPRDRDFARSLLAGFAKFGGFTDRQRPHVQRLAAIASGPAPEPSPDAALAQRLQAALDAGMIAPGDLNFAGSLLAGFARFGGFTDRQRPYAERLAASAPGVAPAQAPAPVASPVPAPAVIATPFVLEGVARRLGPGSFARLRVGQLDIAAKNDFSVAWIKFDGELVARMSLPSGEVTFLSRAREDARRQARAALEQVGADPLAALKSHGLATGRCGCCGRALTDPESIAKGIGPVCEGRFHV